MEYGYSMRLGKHVYAFALDYADCGRFVICCPACRERVFKGVRRRANGSDHHYLSHFRRDATAEDCEMRVAAMGVSVSDSLDHAPRGQNLEEFIRLLNDLIDRDVQALCPEDTEGQELQRALAESVCGTEFLMELADDMAERAAGDEMLLNPEEFEEQVRLYAEGFSGSVFEGGAPATQVRTAGDLWRHVLTPLARENFRRLFGRAYAVLLSRLDVTAEDREITSEEGLLHYALRILPRQDGMAGDLILRLMGGHPAGDLYGLEAGSLQEALRFHLVEEMIGVLLRLPYEEFWREEERETTADTSPQTVEDGMRARHQFGIDDYSQKEIEDAVLQSVPRKGQVARELLLRKTVGFLELEGLGKKTRSRINKAIFRQAQAGLLRLDHSYERVWLASGAG